MLQAGLLASSVSSIASLASYFEDVRARLVWGMGSTMDDRFLSLDARSLRAGESKEGRQELKRYVVEFWYPRGDSFTQLLLTKPLCC